MAKYSEATRPKRRGACKAEINSNEKLAKPSDCAIRMLACLASIADEPLLWPVAFSTQNQDIDSWHADIC